MEISEKQKIEKATAQIFLGLYNKKMSTNYEIQELSDKPDVKCEDINSEGILELEITLLQDLQGDIPYILGRGEKQKSPTTNSPVVSFFDDTLAQLDIILKKKILCSYGKNTALVIRQVSTLWGITEWNTVADDFRNEILKGNEDKYGKGIWIICTDSSTWPASNCLYCLSN